MTTRFPGKTIACAARLALGLCLAAVVPASALAAAKTPGAPPVILGASANSDLTQLALRGRHFGTGGLSVKLEGKPLTVLASDDATATAALDPGTAPGKYRVEVTRADGATATAKVTLKPRPAPVPAAPLGAPVIEVASAESDMAVVTIRGRNLGTTMPSVALGGKALRTLTFDGTTVVSRLPPKTAPGKYQVTVKRADGASASLQATLGR
jgi:hypothetical protein